MPIFGSKGQMANNSKRINRREAEERRSKEKKKH